MPQFISFDPPEFDDRIVIASHEAAHILLAYHYGFRIGHFRTFPVETFMSGAFNNAVNLQHEKDDPLGAREAKARQLLAGELSARITAGLPTDRMVLAVNRAELVTPTTPLNAIWNRLYGDVRDASKVVELARQVNTPDWWEWIWKRHAETEVLLNEYRHQLAKIMEKVERVLRRHNQWIGYPLWQRCLGTVWSRFNPPEWEPGTSIVSASALIQYARSAGVPIANTNYVPHVL